MGEPPISGAPSRSRRWVVALPLLGFMAVAGLFLLRLYGGDPSKIPSALIGRPAPQTALPALEGLVNNGVAVPGLDPAAFKGKVSIVNVWASWCVPCHDEAPLLTELARDKRLPRAMILVDMIGDRDLSIRRETHSAGWLTEIVWDAAARLGHGRHFLRDTLPVEDDHVPFLRLGVPATLLIDFDYPPWHTADDTLDKISAQSLSVVGEVLLEALPSVEHYLTRSTGGTR